MSSSCLSVQEEVEVLKMDLIKQLKLMARDHQAMRAKVEDLEHAPSRDQQEVYSQCMEGLESMVSRYADANSFSLREKMRREMQDREAVLKGELTSYLADYVREHMVASSPNIGMSGVEALLEGAKNELREEWRDCREESEDREEAIELVHQEVKYLVEGERMKERMNDEWHQE